jgi:hypothetical protein
MIIHECNVCCSALHHLELFVVNLRPFLHLSTSNPNAAQPHIPRARQCCCCPAPAAGCRPVPLPVWVWGWATRWPCAASDPSTSAASPAGRCVCLGGGGHKQSDRGIMCFMSAASPGGWGGGHKRGEGRALICIAMFAMWCWVMFCMSVMSDWLICYVQAVLNITRAVTSGCTFSNTLATCCVP